MEIQANAKMADQWLGQNNCVRKLHGKIYIFFLNHQNKPCLNLEH